MNRIYRYREPRRSGDIAGMFAVDDNGEACLRALIESGRDVYYGEVLGKHSEVVSVLKAEHLTLVEATPDEIATVLRVLGVGVRGSVAVINGMCPLTCEGTCNLDRTDPDMMLAWARGEIDE